MRQKFDVRLGQGLKKLCLELEVHGLRLRDGSAELNGSWTSLKVAAWGQEDFQVSKL